MSSDTTPDAPIADTRQAILRAAQELVARLGANGTTVRDITAACGANGAAVNYHFQSKDRLVALATEAITADVNAERLRRLDAMETAADGQPLPPRDILRALVEPILDVSRSADGGSLYVRSVFQMRVDARAAQHSFGQNAHAARRFVAAIRRTFPALDEEAAVWVYEYARGASIHLLANLDPLSRRFEQLLAAPQTALPERPRYELDATQVRRVIDLVLQGFVPAASTRDGEA